MGLFLSVLVACVGVIELISVCCNVRRNLTLRPISGDLSEVRKNYVQELADITKSGDQAGGGIERHVPTFRLNSHEDIDIEYKKNVLIKSRTPSPRRFLLTEKDADEARGSSLPRQFVVSEEPQGIKKSQCQNSIPEFFIQEQKNNRKSPNRPRYVLKDHEGRSGSPIPLPSQFLVTEEDSTAVAEREEHCRRSPSPYPPLDLPQTHRNSVSKEILDDPVVSILEVDEDLYKSRSASPQIIEDNDGITINFNTDSNALSSLSFKTQSISQTQKGILATTVIERARSKSESTRVDNNGRTCMEVVQTAVSSSQTNEDEYASFESVQEDFLESSSSFDENYLNNLDGVGKQKFVKRNFSSRRTVKRLSSVTNSVEDSGESSNKENGPKILAIAAEKLESESASANSKEPSSVASTSREPDVKKEPEPFWVKH